MTGPKRIQRKRTRGWRMPEGAVYVGRPTKWGNPFIVDHFRQTPSWRVLDWRWGTALGRWNDSEWFDTKVQAMTNATVKFQAALLADERLDFKASELDELRGRDLACWCPLSSPCHADVLLELANETDA